MSYKLTRNFISAVSQRPLHRSFIRSLSTSNLSGKNQTNSISLFKRHMNTQSEDKSIDPIVSTKNEEKKEDKPKKKSISGLIFTFIGNNKKLVFSTLALWIIYWRYVVNTRKEAEKKATEFISMDPRTTANFLDILKLSEKDLGIIAANARHHSIRGMINMDVMGTIVARRVTEARKERQTIRDEILTERFRIEAEMAGYIPSEEALANIEENKRLEGRLSSTDTGSSWISWLPSLSFLSLPSSAPVVEEEPLLPTFERDFDDWFDDQASDDVPITNWEPLLIFKGLPTSFIGEKPFIKVEDAILALTNVVNTIISPTSPYHKYALPNDLLRRLHVDMGLTYSAYYTANESREGLIDYVRVLTGQFLNFDNCRLRAERVILQQGGNWNALTEEEKDLVTYRLQYVFERQKLSRHYRFAKDQNPARKMELVWYYSGNRQTLTKPEFERLIHTLISSGHFSTEAIVKRVSTWPVAFATISSKDIANSYFSYLGKSNNDSINLDEFKKAAFHHGFLETHDFHYTRPDTYTKHSGMTLWFKEKKYQLFNIEPDLRDSLDLVFE